MQERDQGGRPVYINGLGVSLPNAPVDNEHIEEILGVVNDVPSRVKRRILENNGIRSRYYAIDPATGRQTHTNASLTAEAVRALAGESGLTLDDIDCLVCSTSTPDQLIPNHALMVQGELSAPACEVVSTAGVCASGVSGLKYATMGLSMGWMRNAVVCASELVSPILRGEYLSSPRNLSEDAVDRHPRLAFNQDFLRWMLSDGAAAALLSTRCRAGTMNLRIEWIEMLSFAGEVETCMYWGAAKREDGSLLGWREHSGPRTAVELGMFNLSQDVKLLGREVAKRCISCAFPRILEKHPLNPDDVQWFLPHYSSNFFREEVHDRLIDAEFPLPYDKWYSNLTSKGNTGSAAVYVMLDELLRSGRLSDGDGILCFVPESARFTAAYLLLTAVNGGSPDGD